MIFLAWTQFGKISKFCLTQCRHKQGRSIVFTNRPQGAAGINNQQGARTMTNAVVVDADHLVGKYATVHFRGKLSDCRAYAADRRDVQVITGCDASGTSIFHVDLRYMMGRGFWRLGNAYAIVPTQGMYGSGSAVRVAELCDNLATARSIAARLTAEYQRGMKRYGGSRGGYRVIAWGANDDTILGCDLDRTPDAK